MSSRLLVEWKTGSSWLSEVRTTRLPVLEMIWLSIKFPLSRDTRRQLGKPQVSNHCLHTAGLDIPSPKHSCWVRLLKWRDIWRELNGKEGHQPCGMEILWCLIIGLAWLYEGWHIRSSRRRECETNYNYSMVPNSECFESRISTESDQFSFNRKTIINH